MDLRESYSKSIYASTGQTNGERIRAKLTDNFVKLLDYSPNSYSIEHTTLEDMLYERKLSSERVIVNDYRENDQSFYDEKALFCLNTSKVKVGSYVVFHDSWYLVIFEEKRPHGAYKQFTMRECNSKVCIVKKWLFEDELLVPRFKQEILTVPIVLESLTLYTEGVKEINYGTIAIVDGKRNITYGAFDRFEKFMSLGRRVMISGKAIYSVTHVDDYSYRGIIQASALQGLITPNDNEELSVADYYAHTNDSSDTTDIPNLGNYILKLEGVERLKIGSTQRYDATVLTANGDKVDREVELEWSIEHIKGDSSDITTDFTNNKSLTIKATNDIDIVGRQFKILVSIVNEPKVFIEKNIKITSIMG